MRQIPGWWRILWTYKDNIAHDELCDQLLGFPAYFIVNAKGQRRYPRFTNREWTCHDCFFFFFESHFPSDFVPTSVIFAPHQYNDIVISDIGVFLWLAIIAGSIVSYGFSTVFRVYLLPYLW